MGRQRPYVSQQKKRNQSRKSWNGLIPAPCLPENSYASTIRSDRMADPADRYAVKDHQPDSKKSKS